MSEPGAIYTGAVELGCTPEEAKQFRSARLHNDADYSSYPLEKLPDNPEDIYEYLSEAETYLVPNGNYEQDFALFNNELNIFRANDSVLVTAEHATRQVRAGKSKAADVGTGGLVLTLSKKAECTSLIAVGRQTGDANWDKTHPLKDEMTKIITIPVNTAHLSVHGIAGGATTDARDLNGFKAMLGIGTQPSEATKALADLMTETARDLGLKIGINQSHLAFDSKNRMPILDETGRVKQKTFSGASNGNTTTLHSKAIADELGKGDSYASIQVELSTVLRLLPDSFKTFRTLRDRKIGAGLGYMFVKQAVDSVKLL